MICYLYNQIFQWLFLWLYETFNAIKWNFFFSIWRRTKSIPIQSSKIRKWCPTKIYQKSVREILMCMDFMARNKMAWLTWSSECNMQNLVLACICIVNDYIFYMFDIEMIDLFWLKNLIIAIKLSFFCIDRFPKICNIEKYLKQ